MAKARMIHRKLWECEQFAQLGALEKLLYIAMLVVADDEGCFRADGKFWRREIFFGLRIGESKIEQMVHRISETGLIIVGTAEKGFAGFHPNWHVYQTLRRDKCKPSPFEDLLTANGRTPRVSNPPQGKVSEVNEKGKEGIILDTGAYDREHILKGMPENRREMFSRPSPKDFVDEKI